jgi:enamine deaminase RidA (YjgF/YER057c/UK114 family)
MRHPRTAALLTGGALMLTVSACADEAVFSSSVSDETDAAAAGISVPADASIFRSSATGPERLNYMAEDGDPMSFVDPDLLDDDGKLPEDMTVTEAQSLQVLSQLEDLLTDRKLKLYEVGTVRVYLAADGDDGADFDGWERAYRRYFANIDRDTGRSLLEEPVETTSASASTSASATASASASDEPTESTSPEAEASPTSELYPGTDNRTRPTMVTVGVAEQPVEGWLVQVEIEAVHGES